MTQQPFSRPGAIDLSGLKRPASAPPSGGAACRRGRRRGGSAYSVDVDEQNFQALLEASMTAPVVLVFYSTGQAPESATMARDVATVAERVRRPLPRRPDRHRRLAGDRAGDADPAGARCCSCCSTAGRRRSRSRALIALDELRTLFNQLGQQLTAQGITGRHQPRTGAPAPVGEDAGGAARRPAVRRRPGRPGRGRHRPRRRGVPEAGRRQPRRHRGRSRASRWPRCCSAPRAPT